MSKFIKLTDAHSLLTQLQKLEKKYGSLKNIPLFGFVEDKMQVTGLDVFFDGKDNHLHSIDINLLNEE